MIEAMPVTNLLGIGNDIRSIPVILREWISSLITTIRRHKNTVATRLITD